MGLPFSVKWERKNTSIKKSLVKVLDGNPCDWPNIIEDLFAHRVSKHTSTKFSPFFPVCNREPTSPVDVKYNLFDIDGNESEHFFNKERFDAVFTTAISMKASIYQVAGENSICSVQKNVLVITDTIKYLKRLKWVKTCF